MLYYYGNGMVVIILQQFLVNEMFMYIVFYKNI